MRRALRVIMTHVPTRVALLALFAVVAQTTAFAQTCPVPLGNTPAGSTGAVAAEGALAVFGVGRGTLHTHGVEVADLSDPAAPRTVGSIGLADVSWVSSLAISGTLVVVGAGTNGLVMLDISDPTHPTVVGSVELSGMANGVTLAAGLAFVAAKDAGLRIVDLTEPSQPVEIGFVDTPGIANRVAVGGGLAVVADSDQGVRVIDVTDPASPVEVGYWYDAGQSSVDVVMAGGVAWVADEAGSALRVLDLADPAHPAAAGALPLPREPTRLVLDGTTIFLTGLSGTEPDRLYTIDVSSPLAPAEVGFIEPDYLRELAVGDGFVALCRGSLGLLAVDLRPPGGPVAVGTIQTTNRLVDVALHDTVAVVTDSMFGVRTLDVSRPWAPSERGSVALPGGSAFLSAKSEIAQVGDGATLRSVSFADPAHPVEIGSLELPGLATGVAAGPGFTYVVGRVDGQQGMGYLRVVGTSLPTAPFEVGGFDLPGIGLHPRVALAGDLLAVTGAGDGFIVVDVSTPALPVVFGTAAIPGVDDGVVIRGTRAYVAGDWDGVTVVSLVDPSQPAVVSTTAVGQQAWGVAVSGGYLYVGGSQGLTAMDLEDPDHPVVVGEFSDNYQFNTVNNVVAARGYVYAVGYDNGLFVFRDCGEVFRDGFESGDTAAWSAP